MIWAGHITGMGEKRNTYGLLVRKPEGKSPFRRPRHRPVDNIKINLGGQMEYYGLDWCASEQGQVERSCECGNEPLGSIKCWECIGWMHNWWPLK
jgi:hypothetical protein